MDDAFIMYYNEVFWRYTNNILIALKKWIQNVFKGGMPVSRFADEVYTSTLVSQYSTLVHQYPSTLVHWYRNPPNLGGEGYWWPIINIVPNNNLLTTYL